MAEQKPKPDLNAAIAAVLQENMQYRKANDKLEKMKKEKKFTVSKIMLALVMASYFAGLLVMLWAAAVTVLRRPDDIIPAIGVLSAYIGVPTSTTIGFYSWKAKNENVPKIEKSFENENNSCEANEQL